jgi:hypothetical protein
MPEPPPEAREEPAHLPWQQLIFDDVFLLMALGLVVPTLLYIVWGLMELASVEPFVPGAG